jgi:hypothetical protein
LHRTVPIKDRFGKTVLNVEVAATLIVEDVDEVDVCIYRTCDGCQFQCLRKILAVFKRFHIAYHSFEKGQSVVFKFRSSEDALMAYNALKWAGIRKAKLQFHS